MTWIDWALAALVVGYCLYLIFRKKKPGGCCGDCSACSGCHEPKE